MGQLIIKDCPVPKLGASINNLVFQAFALALCCTEGCACVRERESEELETASS